MKNTTQRRGSRTMAKVGFFAKVLAIITGANEAGEKVNKNKVYAQFGIGTGNPIYTPKRTKFKGYMRNS
jgi:hypothetical protein